MKKREKTRKKREKNVKKRNITKYRTAKHCTGRRARAMGKRSTHLKTIENGQGGKKRVPHEHFNPPIRKQNRIFINRIFAFRNRIFINRNRICITEVFVGRSRIFVFRNRKNNCFQNESKLYRSKLKSRIRKVRIRLLVDYTRENEFVF